jgi:hypothetical protein
MNPDWQSPIAAVLVILTAIAFVLRWLRARKNHGSGGCSTCPSCAKKPRQ